MFARPVKIGLPAPGAIIVGKQNMVWSPHIFSPQIKALIMKIVPLMLACCLWIGGCAQSPVGQSSAEVVPKYLEDTPRLAVLAAYAPEIEALLPNLTDTVEYQVNGVEFYVGQMEGVDVVVFLTGISLVNAAMNTQLVIDHFNVEAILVSGVAGGVDPSLSFADVTVPAKWGQYNEMVYMRETETGEFAPHPGLGQQAVDHPDRCVERRSTDCTGLGNGLATV